MSTATLERATSCTHRRIGCKPCGSTDNLQTGYAVCIHEHIWEIAHCDMHVTSDCSNKKAICRVCWDESRITTSWVRLVYDK